MGGGFVKQESLRRDQNQASPVYGEKGTQINPDPCRSQRQHN